MKKECAICNIKIGLFKPKFNLIDGIICPACASNAMAKDRVALRSGRLSSEEAKASILSNKIHRDNINKFIPTSNPHPNIEVDINNKKIKLASKINGEHFEEILDFDKIISWEVLKDSETIYKKEGVGRAVVGGILFGETGAVIGAVTGDSKNKTMIKSIKLRITISDMDNPIRFIHIHEGTDLEVGSEKYKHIVDSTQKLIGIIENIQNY
ncbi:DUF4428 domain-containing protein [Clostridium sartagoforme]|uniref:DUF4428 domain-containing protein n=1 Tax=Clostridium sartagoforme TaxID=84031 RepID=A0A4S2DHZ9_9CLOT|nr:MULTISPECIES: DUF4428 domain-containing protein [Clostridium]MBS5938097.1 DUF4428 domain-containing protein [Clostridium sp.]TGY40444.1 DUF4428 domain-containing protein [Clostridium sartagoforme]